MRVKVAAALGSTFDLVSGTALRDQLTSSISLLEVALRRWVVSMADTPQYEDQVIRRVFAISMQEQDADASSNPPVICLEGLAEVRISTLLLCWHSSSVYIYSRQT